jgi:hypothetical protein
MRHLLRHAVKFYSRNPHHAVAHAVVAKKAAVHIGKLAWTHGPRVAKHTTSFMQKAALKGFKLFGS